MDLNKLLEDFSNNHSGKICNRGKLLDFVINDQLFDQEKNITVYNPTRPIKKGDRRFLLGRVEPKDSTDSRVMFFVEKDGKWQYFDHPVFKLEDPFYVENIQGWQVLGGVKTFRNTSGGLGYKTVFYRYKQCATELIDQNGNLSDPFAVSPEGMKDIRLVELKNGMIGLFTRPQGDKAGLGKIAYSEIASLDQLEEAIPKAKIIDELFFDDEWGGANELHLLEGGKIGVLGHIATRKNNVCDYYIMSFIFNPTNLSVSDLKILSTADQFECAETKNNSLGKVLFAGGLERKSDGTAELYCGIGDVAAGYIQIQDPFGEYGLVS